MIDARFVPIQAWTGEKTRARKTSPFAVKYQKLLDDLERELKHLRARDIVIQAFVREEDIRNDGWPRSSARFREPGIILSFRAREGEEISFPCDTYKNWDSNLRAICLTLVALRAIDRYGVTKRAEQYKGWKKIAAPNHEVPRRGLGSEPPRAPGRRVQPFRNPRQRYGHRFSVQGRRTQDSDAVLRGAA